MLTVKTFVKYIDNSKGFGLFAGEDIKKDQCIWRKSPLDMVISDGDFRNYSELEKEFIYKYGYKEGIFWIICTDNARYMNHEDFPNTYDNKEGTFAKIDIAKGDEITTNYYEICEFVKTNGLGFSYK